jgi:hypothetical protein
LIAPKVVSSVFQSKLLRSQKHGKHFFTKWAEVLMIAIIKVDLLIVVFILSLLFNFIKSALGQSIQAVSKLRKKMKSEK